MTEFTNAILVANSYRFSLIIAGTLMVYWGYRLFLHGYLEKAGELRASVGKYQFLLKSAAPGIFFAVLGVATITIGVFKKIELSLPNGATAKMSFPKGDKPCDDTIEKGYLYQGMGKPTAKKDNSLPPK